MSQERHPGLATRKGGRKGGRVRAAARPQNLRMEALEERAVPAAMLMSKTIAFGGPTGKGALSADFTGDRTKDTVMASGAQFTTLDGVGSRVLSSFSVLPAGSTSTGTLRFG